jgi:hypothetical protein
MSLCTTPFEWMKRRAETSCSIIETISTSCFLSGFFSKSAANVNISTRAFATKITNLRYCRHILEPCNTCHPNQCSHSKSQYEGVAKRYNAAWIRGSFCNNIPQPSNFIHQVVLSTFGGEFKCHSSAIPPPHKYFTTATTCFCLGFYFELVSW